MATTKKSTAKKRKPAAKKPTKAQLQAKRELNAIILFALGVLLLLLAARLVYLRALATGTLPETLFTFLVNTASLSVGLGLFNLVPVPPLDGSKVVAVLLPDRAYNWLMRYEQFGMVLLVIIISVGIGSNALDAAIRWVFDLFCRIVGF